MSFSTPTRNQHKPFNQLFPPRAKIKRKKEYNPKAWIKETSSGASYKNDEKTEKYRTTERTSRNSQEQISNLPERELRIMIVKMF